MVYRIIELPPFTAVSSGVDRQINFGEDGILGKFDAYFSAIKPEPQDSFMPRDFLFYDPLQKGLVWWWALAEGMDDGGYERVDFEGGLYLCYHYRDGDEDEANRLYQEAMNYLKVSGLFETDERPNHYAMGHIITPREVIRAQRYAVMETFIPIRLKSKAQ